jgi:hypothetical protein
MIDKLVNFLPSFSGKVNQTRCFLHIINLVAKSVIQQFDVEKRKADEALDEAELELCTLAEGINLEDVETQEDQKNDDDDDDVEGWINERNTLSINDCEELDASVCPVKLMLVKMNKLKFVLTFTLT